MAPPWGRPPEGLDPRARREWERRAHEWELSQTRFEELDSDGESISSSSQAYAQYMGYDGPSRRRPVSATAFTDLAYGEGYDAEDDDARGAEWQLAMREKEEELAERALRRVRRARLRGENNVDLSREELDALERRRYRQELERRPPARAPPSRQQTLPAAAAAASKPKKKASGGLFGTGGSPKSKPSKDRRAATYPLLQEPDAAPQHQLPPASSTSSLYKLGNNSPRASRRSSKSRLKQQQPPSLPPFYDLPATSNYRPSSSRSSRRGDASPTRSLPDDPDWSPRSRSSSSAQPHPNVDPFSYQILGSENRRIVSEPLAMNPNVTFSNVRRNPPRQAHMTGVGGRPREVIDLSDDDDEEEEEEEEEEEDELDGDGESDEGVRVDVVPEPRAGYHVQQGATTDAGVPRARKGRAR